MGIPEVLLICGFSTSLMLHLERPFATSAEFCVELSEYNTPGLHLKIHISVVNANSYTCTTYDLRIEVNGRFPK